ncbi:hypothetical protein [Faunimonas sp. B44]
MFAVYVVSGSRVDRRGIFASEAMATWAARELNFWFGRAAS